jgi:hypothetical protein
VRGGSDSDGGGQAHRRGGPICARGSWPTPSYEPPRRAASEYMGHYHKQRNHQGLDKRLIVTTTTQATDGAVQRHTRDLEEH